MRASELINELNTAVEKYGDLDVLVRYPEDGSCWEDFEVVPDPPTPMEAERGIEGTIDVNVVGNGDKLPELARYEDDGDGPKRHLPKDPHLPAGANIGTFEVIFEVAGVRYYCYVAARNMSEALGIFFKNHQHINYNMVIDHIAVA